jgi:uncharacterized metal-binding protein
MASGPIEGAGAFLGCLLGIILTPDLDQIGISKSEWGLVKKLGPLGFIWMALWWPYAVSIKHRSLLSHLPVLGTAIRLIYCAALLIIIWTILGRPALVMPVWGWALLRGGLKGLVVSDTGHFILDLLPRKKGKRR